ncbi:MAG: glucose-6-phosphate dehydrogenase [Pseudomonadales bacterium]|nr:glucose-6-phosphate dehydrogenase [Pseudomonadales bacterium]HNC76650.1 glucose-6-phosphate dehydrogenase [Pseudomonadales bacterium]HNN35599.1 glucose-6-phosphate dehydrogenase [Pseudomonadales bacterium]
MTLTPLCPFEMVVFGGTGDLALRKLMPALYHRYQEGQFPADCRIIAVSRTPLNREGYLVELRRALQKYVAGSHFEEHSFNSFAAFVDYVELDGSQPEGYQQLRQRLHGDHDTPRVFYLATAPSLFGPICHQLRQAGLVHAGTRVVLEKPLGHDLASSRLINDQVGEVFGEQQIYRIDHYLGKETVQNLMVLRFGNALFEPIWRTGFIDHVQITVAEQVGVEGRGGYYDQAGALRDMVQNHLLQLLCLVAMEPPSTLDANAVRDEKVKVLNALEPITAQNVTSQTVRGQYRAGAVGGVPVPGYLDESGIDPLSSTETFVAIKTQISNWRWAGVPFYLRTGKRLQNRISEIVINFHQVPHSIFEPGSGALINNRLVLRLQPEEGVRLAMMAKQPGPGMQLRSVDLNLDFAETFKGRLPDAYERLLIDVIRGRPTLFMRRDEQEAAWRWCEPILAGWDQHPDNLKKYISGTWGPTAAIALIERDGFTWHEE